MFTQLAPLVAKATLLIIVAPGQDGRMMRLTVNLKGDEDKKSALGSYVVEDTPENLDAGLAESLIHFREQNLGLAAAQANADAEIAILAKEKAAQVAAARKLPAKPEVKKTAPAVVTPAADEPGDGTLALGLETETAAPAPDSHA